MIPRYDVGAVFKDESGHRVRVTRRFRDLDAVTPEEKFYYAISDDSTVLIGERDLEREFTHVTEGDLIGEGIGELISNDSDGDA